ncbi:hypothetical protein TNCV_958961 [Trichonephila clavipes]|nr:hypothetical protein TNCV_958961 [Trichonephila clavipes]
MSSNLVPLKIHSVEELKPVKICRGSESSRWRGVEARRGDSQSRCHSRHDREEVLAQMSSSSLDHGSEGRGPTPKALV